jgi:two-component system OmpR family sensor kinase/two-component system sensor histidine kinase QseC
MRALRVRLLVHLLSAVALAALIVGGLTYRNVLAQSEAQFDYQLQQMALSLRDQGAITEDEAHTLANPNFDFVVQIWSIDGARVYTSRPHSGLPPRSVLGLSDVDAGGTRWRVFATISDNGFSTHIIQVAQPQAIRERLAAATALRSVLPWLAFIPLMALAVGWTVRSSFRPLTRLADEVRGRKASDLNPLRSAEVPEEVLPLVDALNGMLERLGGAFEAQRGFVANAAHELRSPLTALKLQLSLLERAEERPDDPATRQAATQELKRGVERATRLVEQLLVLARTDPGAAAARPHQPLDWAEIVRSAVADAVPLASSRRIDLALDAETEVPVNGDAEDLRILARNLIDNAVRYTPRGGTVRVAVCIEGAPGAPSGSGGQGGMQQAVLSVDDSGPGIPAAEREQVFDRFYRRDPGRGAGSGLGLAIVRAIAERHGGSVALADAPAGGLRVEVLLPGGGPARALAADATAHA